MELEGIRAVMRSICRMRVVDSVRMPSTSFWTVMTSGVSSMKKRYSPAVHTAAS